jgi:hypothetical protein
MGNANIAVLSNVNFDGFMEGAHVILNVGLTGNPWSEIGRWLESPKSPGPERGNACACEGLLWDWGITLTTGSTATGGLENPVAGVGARYQIN